MGSIKHYVRWVNDSLSMPLRFGKPKQFRALKVRRHACTRPLESTVSSTFEVIAESAGGGRRGQLPLPHRTCNACVYAGGTAAR